MTTETTSECRTTTPSSPSSLATKVWNTLGIVAAILVVTGMLWAGVVAVYDSLKTIESSRAEEQRLLAASSKSDAHQFLVHHWMKCSNLLDTRASCYASIRSTAAARGEAFVRQVDAAAIELGLI